LSAPFVVYDFAFNYFIAIPLHYICQIFVLGANLQLHLPARVSDLWQNKRHLSGYIPVTEVNTQYDAHWLFCAINAAVFVGFSSANEVYRRIKFMEDYKEEDDEALIQAKIQKQLKLSKVKGGDST